MQKTGVFFLVLIIFGSEILFARSIDDYLERAENFKEISRYREALFYYTKAEQKSISLRNKTYLDRIYRGMGDCYAGQGSAREAKEYYTISLQYNIRQPNPALFIGDYYYNLRMFMPALRYYNIYEKYRSREKDPGLEYHLKYSVSIAWDLKKESREKARSYLKDISIKKNTILDQKKCFEIIDRSILKKVDSYEKDKNEGTECLKNLLSQNYLDERIYISLIHYSRKIELKREWALRLFYLFGDNELYQWPLLLFHYSENERERSLKIAEKMEKKSPDYYLIMATLLYEDGKKYEAERYEKKALEEEKNQ